MSEYLISIKIGKLEEGGYLAASDTLQGLIVQGRSVAETMAIAQDVARKLIESYIEHGDPLPYGIEPSQNVMQDVKIPISVTARDVIRKLKRAGFVFGRQAKGSHEIWYNPTTKR